MTNKESFINEIKEIIDRGNPLTEEAMEYFESLSKITEKPIMTENGKQVIKAMIDNEEKYNNMFKAKDIGNEIGKSGRQVSGTLKKLVTDEFVEKVGENPTVYSITEKGKTVNLDF